jgi:hypothetical protein
MGPLQRKLIRVAIRPAAMFAFRRSPWGLALVTVAPTALKVGKAVYDAWTDPEDLPEEPAPAARKAKAPKRRAR